VSGRLTLPLGLRARLALLSLLAVGAFAALNLASMEAVVGQAVGELLRRRAVTHAAALALQIEVPLLQRDFLALRALLDEQRQADDELAFVLVLDGRRRLLAHTFEGAAPQDLLRLGPLAGGHGLPWSRALVDPRSGQRFHLAVQPILGGRAGELRVGVADEAASAILHRVHRVLRVLVLGFAVLGLLGALFLGYWVGRPLLELIRSVDALGPGGWPAPLPEGRGDEVGALLRSFNAMALRLREAERAREAQQTALLRAEKLAAVGTLAAGVAHEINNPVAGMLGLVERIRRQPERQEQNAEYLAMVAESLGQVEEIVGRLLQFAQVHEPQRAGVPLAGLAQRALALLEYQRRGRSVRPVIRVPAELWVWGDEDELTQVLLNLLSNAYDAMESGGELLVEGSRCGDRVCLRVQDEGTGIPPEDLGRIFDPFFSTKGVGEGTGLGLSLCLRIVENHGGSLEVEPLAHGTCVWLRLPAARGDEPAAPGGRTEA